MATTTPYFNPNWLKRQSRMNTPRPPRSSSMNDPRDAATGMFNAGLQIDEGGAPKPTRDYGSLLRLNSSQMNPLSRGVKPGSFSSLGQPMNSMYANNPGFFRSQIAQRNQSLTPGAPVMTREQRIAQAQQEGTFGTIRDKFNIDNEGAGLSMNEFGNIFKPKPTQKVPSIQKVNPLDPDTPGGASALARSNMMNRKVDSSLLEKRGFGNPVASPQDTPTAAKTPSQQDMNRAGLEERASGLRLLREMSQTPLQIVNTPPTWDENGFDTLTGKYGTGVGGIKDPEKEGTVNGRGFAETMQGLANKQVREGTWREGDALPYEDQNDGLNPDKIRRSVKDVTEENRQKILSRQRIAARTR